MFGFRDGPKTTSALFYNPIGLSIDVKGNMYVTDGYHNIRVIYYSTATVQTLAGNGMIGSLNDVGNQATFKTPKNIITNNNGSLLYVTDFDGYLIREIACTASMFI